MRSNLPLSRCLKLAATTALAALLLTTAAQAQTTYRWVGKDGRVHYSDQPPPPADIKDVQLKKLKGGNVIETGGASSYETQQAAKNFPLTLYTSDNCKENCKMARDLLSQRGAPYSEKVIQTTDDAAEYRKATGSQDLIVPALTAGKRLEKGFEEEAWHRLLDGAGYPARGAAKGPAPAAGGAKAPAAPPKPEAAKP